MTTITLLEAFARSRVETLPRPAKSQRRSHRTVMHFPMFLD